MKLLLNDSVNLLENNDEYNVTFKNDDDTYDVFIKILSKQDIAEKQAYKLEKGVECLNIELKANYYVNSYSDSPYTCTITINPVNEPEKPKYGLGDVNKDNKINSLDAVEILKYVAKKKTLTDEQLALADTTRDGKVNSLDAVRILKYVAKKKMLTEKQLLLADTTKDDKVNSLDAVRILKFVAKKINEI